MCGTNCNEFTALRHSAYAISLIWMYWFIKSATIVVNYLKVLLQRCFLLNELPLRRVGPSRPSLGVLINGGLKFSFQDLPYHIYLRNPFPATTPTISPHQQSSTHGICTTSAHTTFKFGTAWLCLQLTGLCSTSTGRKAQALRCSTVSTYVWNRHRQEMLATQIPARWYDNCLVM